MVTSSAHMETFTLRVKQQIMTSEIRLAHEADHTNEHITINV